MLKDQILCFLVLIVDTKKTDQFKGISNIRTKYKTVHLNGQNSGELWVGMPIVLPFSDDYQLIPIIDERPIQGFAKRREGAK